MLTRKVAADSTSRCIMFDDLEAAGELVEVGRETDERHIGIG